MNFFQARTTKHKQFFSSHDTSVHSFSRQIQFVPLLPGFRNTDGTVQLTMVITDSSKINFMLENINWYVAKDQSDRTELKYGLVLCIWWISPLYHYLQHNIYCEMNGKREREQKTAANNEQFMRTICQSKRNEINMCIDLHTPTHPQIRQTNSSQQSSFFSYLCLSNHFKSGTFYSEIFTIFA